MKTTIEEQTAQDQEACEVSEAIATAVTEEKLYRQKSNLNFLDEFARKIAGGDGETFNSTGFVELDKALDGGIYEGLYIIGAITTIGKTSFVLQIADQIAVKGHDVLFFSIEMSRRELTAKSISRLTFTKHDSEKGKSMRDLTVKQRVQAFSQEDKSNVSAAIDDYKVYAGNIFIEECEGTKIAIIEDSIKKHVNILNTKPVVIIDYLQLIDSCPDTGKILTDKQATDRTVLDLKRLSRKYELPIIGISSFNRSGYQNSAGFESFKESGGIEYSADVLIGIEYEKINAKDDIKQYMIKDPRLIKLSVLKNRNGATGKEIIYQYFPKFSCFQEKELKENNTSQVATSTKNTNHTNKSNVNRRK